jgi:hypothetical protein
MGKGVRHLDNKLPTLLRIMAEHEKLRHKPYVKVGYPVESEETNAPKRVNLEGDKKGFAHAVLNLIDIVIWMEFGTKTIPERSFIRATADAIHEEIREYIAELVGQIYDGTMTVEVALDRVALKVIAKTKDRIRHGIDPPLALSTVARKGSTTPLIDTGQLLNGQTFVRIMKS